MFSARGAPGADALALSVERESPDASGRSPRREISVPPRAMAAASAPSRPPGEVNWDTLDKRKFFVGGAALFSGVTCALYPLTVIKTRQMVDGSGKSLSGVSIVRDILRSRGVLGLYQGFGTIVVGTLPIRMVYLSTLEVVKARARGVCEALDLPPIAHGIADAAGGATASMCSQVLGVPIDIISQRQMVQGVSVKSADGGSTTLKGYRNGWHALRHIVATDGVRGLYRGFGASVMTLVPGSALWWGFYGTYQRLIWSVVPAHLGGGGGGVESSGDRGVGVGGGVGVGVGTSGSHGATPSDGTLIGVQIASGVCAGASSGFLTTPLDIVKTRLQVLSGQPGGDAHTFSSTARELYREHGAAGFLRGVRPRMTSVSIWGTTMVTTYEFLKRLASAEPGEET